MFDKDSKSINDCENIHNRLFKIQDNLFLAGFGGATPAYQGETQKWEGCLFACHLATDKQKK